MGKMSNGVRFDKMLVITNRLLCDGDFLERIETVAAKKPKGIVLREKDLGAGEYRELAMKVLKICRRYDVDCILHSRAEAARELGCPRIHLPFSRFCGDNICVKSGESERLSGSDGRSRLLMDFDLIGVSVHSVEEAIFAEKMGADYVTAGHIFLTDCKKGLAARGLPFLKNVCESVGIPVYAIGGITPDHVDDVLGAGAAGVCVMSGIMRDSVWGV